MKISSSEWILVRSKSHPERRTLSVWGGGSVLLCKCVFCSRRAKWSKKSSWTAGLVPINGIGGQDNRGDTEDEVIL